MVALLRSIVLFLWGVLKRFYFWLPAILLDPFDLYNKYIKLRLPPEWQGDIEMPSEAFPYVLAGGLIWASVMTYHELRTSVGRDPRIPKKLRQLYVTGEQFTKYDLQDESEFAEWKERAFTWHRETLDWINENMSEAAGSRFRDTYKYQNALRVIHPNAVNEEHFRLVHAANQSRNNLHDLIENAAWDQKDRKESKWRLGNIFR